MIARIDTCTSCGERFAVTPRHTGAEQVYCNRCWRTLAERLELGVHGAWWHGWSALRSEDV